METISKEKIIQVSPKDVAIERDSLIIHFNKKDFTFSLSKLSKRLKNATIQQRQHFILSPSGYGIHWPEIDEDISISALLKEAIKKRK